MITDPYTGDIYQVIDVHQHLDPAHEDLSERVAVLDEAGIDRIVALPGSGAFGPTGQGPTATNISLAALVASAPERVVCGVGRVDLRQGVDACLAEVDRAVDQLGLRGVAWHHRFEGLYLDDPAMPRLVARCAELGVPALVHVIAGSNMEASWRLERLIDACPDATIVALDAFSAVDRAEEIIAIAERHPSLLCDLGAMASIAGWLIKKFLDRIGSERLLLGTDLYLSPRTWYSPGPLLEVAHLDIPPMDKQRILSDNALRLFGFPPQGEQTAARVQPWP